MDSALAARSLASKLVYNTLDNMVKVVREMRDCRIGAREREAESLFSICFVSSASPPPQILMIMEL